MRLASVPSDPPLHLPLDLEEGDDWSAPIWDRLLDILRRFS